MKFISGLILLVALAASPCLAQNGTQDFSLSAAGDAEAGRTAFLKCRACHNLEGNQVHKTGPNLDKIFGRMAGTSPDYAEYSKALSESGIVWNEAELNHWLSDPQNFLPGNKMPFAGIRSDQERKDLIAYIREATE